MEAVLAGSTGFVGIRDRTAAGCSVEWGWGCTATAFGAEEGDAMWVGRG